MIEDFFKSGLVVYLMLGVMAIEAVVLSKYLRRAPAMFWGLCAGAAMAMALLAALTAQSVSLIGILLTFSFLFHILEVRQWLILAKRLPQ